MSGVNFLIGCDPEVFVKKGGKPISAHGLVEGTKESPQKTSHGAVQVDGTALEFNTNPVSYHDFEAFNNNIVRTIADLRRLAGNVNLNIAPVQEFETEYMKALPDNAKELGCDPDYNAYTLEANPRPDGDRNFRTGAGHVHIGWTEGVPVDNPEHMQICAGFVKMLDATVGMYMTYIDRDPRRRELYGCAGAFRPKNYGVEYRTPSNVWIKNRNRRHIMFYLIQYAINKHTAGVPINKVASGLSENEVAAVINRGDHATAAALLSQHLRYAGSSWKGVQEEMRAEELKAAQMELIAA